MWGSQMANPSARVFNSTTTAYAASKVISANNALLFGVSGYNSGPSQFIQIHDASSLPADAAVPKLTYWVDGAASFSIDFGEKGRPFENGIAVA